MLEFVALVLVGLLGIVLLLVGVVALPLILVGGLLKLLWLVVALPFRLAGAVVGMFGALATGMFKLTVLLFSLVALAGGLLVLPLIPLLLLGLAVWGLARLLRPRPLRAAA